jgi:hypothetical protein
MRGRYGEKAYPVQGRAEPEFGPEPSDADLSLIRSPAFGGYPALRDLTPQDVFVWRMVLANDAVDRSYQRLPVPVLEQFARTLPGERLLIAHDKRQPASGVDGGAPPLGEQSRYLPRRRPIRGGGAPSRPFSGSPTRKKGAQ